MEMGMENEYKISGKDLSQEKIEEFRSLLKNRRKESQRPVEGEPLKNERELWIVKKINEYINEEFKLLGLSANPDLSPECFHFLPQEVYSKQLKEDTSADSKAVSANYVFLKGAIYINSDAGNNLRLFVDALHESLHYLSVATIQIYPQRGVGQRRLGYQITQVRKGSETIQRPMGFNEAVTEAVNAEIVHRHKDELKNKFPDEKDSYLFSYTAGRDLLDLIINKIAVGTDDNSEKIWHRIKLGLFTGGMTHLRNIEKTFGKNSLKILAMFSHWVPNETKKKIVAYFETNDLSERQKIADELLSKESPGKNSSE